MDQLLSSLAEQKLKTMKSVKEDYILPDISIGPTQTHYDYNLDKQLTTVTRPDGKVINLSYNATSGDLEQLAIPRGNIDFAYYPTTGYVQTITAPGGESLSFTYDGSFQTGTTFSGTVNGTISRVYNNNFQLQSQTINSTNTISYGYDTDGLLTTAGPLSISRDTTNGMITGTALGNVTDTIDYTDTLSGQNYGEVAHYSASYDTTALYDVVYERDLIGRITKKTEIIAGTTSVFEYTYYQTGWLHTVTKDGTLISTYTYDDNGNRLSYTPETGPAITGTYDDQDRILTYGNTTFTHTKNGELLTKTEGTETTTYHYDVLGNLISVELPNGDLIEYIIDASNRRVGKKVNGTLVQGFLYDSQLHPIAEFDGSGNIVAVFGPGFMIKGGTTYRFITDHLGSIRMIVEPSTGTIAQQIDYDEFGNILNDTNPGFQPFGFAGGLYDIDTGLIKFGSRDYEPEIGRWTNKDPIRFNGETTNLYCYTDNDPVNYIDQAGESGFSAGALAWIGTDLIILDPSDVIPLKWIGYGAVGILVVVDICILDYLLDEAKQNSQRVRNRTDPIVLPRVNPGRTPNGCKPCPSNSIPWPAPGDAHGSTGGDHWHWIEYHQNPITCECHPVRRSGPNRPY